jgi:hypothetical protein
MGMAMGVDDDQESLGRNMGGPSGHGGGGGGAAGLARHGSLGIGDFRGSSSSRPGSGHHRMPHQSPSAAHRSGGGGMPRKQQSREDIQDKFGKFEIRALLEGQRQRTNPGAEGQFDSYAVRIMYTS